MPHSRKKSKFKAADNYEQTGRRVQLVDRKVEEDNGNYTVLNIEGEEDNTKPYSMEGFVYGNRFKTMIDFGFPVTIFALDDLKRTIRESLQVQYFYFNGKLLNLLGYVFCELQVGDSYIKKARVLVAESGSKTMIG